MSIDRDTVLKVAGLARLELTEAEIEQMTGQMNEIVSFVEKINELDTKGIEPTAHVLDVKNKLREDEITESPATLEEILSLAPERHENFISVPRVIE